MDLSMKHALATLRLRQNSPAKLRAALPILLDLYHGIVEELSGPQATVDDLCTLIRHVGGRHGGDAAERLLTEPKLVLDEATLVLILMWTPEHREAAAMQLILTRSLSRGALVAIISYSNDHAHEAADRLMAMGATDEELGLIVGRVPTLADEACRRLGALGISSGNPASA